MTLFKPAFVAAALGVPCGLALTPPVIGRGAGTVSTGATITSAAFHPSMKCKVAIK